MFVYAFKCVIDRYSSRGLRHLGATCVLRINIIIIILFLFISSALIMRHALNEVGFVELNYVAFTFSITIYAWC